MMKKDKGFIYEKEVSEMIDDEMIDERYGLALGRIREMKNEDTVEAPFREFFLRELIWRKNEIGKTASKGLCHGSCFFTI